LIRSSAQHANIAEASRASAPVWRCHTHMGFTENHSIRSVEGWIPLFRKQKTVHTVQIREVCQNVEVSTQIMDRAE